MRIHALAKHLSRVFTNRYPILKESGNSGCEKAKGNRLRKYSKRPSVAIGALIISSLLFNQTTASLVIEHRACSKEIIIDR